MLDVGGGGDEEEQRAGETASAALSAKGLADVKKLVCACPCCLLFFLFLRAGQGEAKATGSEPKQQRQPKSVHLEDRTITTNGTQQTIRLYAVDGGESSSSVHSK